MGFTPNAFVVFATQAQFNDYKMQVLSVTDEMSDDTTYLDKPCFSGWLKGQATCAFVETDPFDVAHSLGAAEGRSKVHTLIVHEDLAPAMAPLAKFVRHFGVMVSQEA